MSTPRQRAANRENAGASTGPRTAAGKARAAANARRHGLAISIWSDRQLSDTAETLARDIAGADSDNAGLAVSRRIAEAQVDLMRVRQARRDLLEREQDPSDVEPPRDAMKEVNALIRFDELTEQGRPIPPKLRRILEQAMQRTKEPGTKNLVPKNLGPKNLGPKNLGPKNLGPRTWDPRTCKIRKLVTASRRTASRNRQVRASRTIAAQFGDPIVRCCACNRVIRQMPLRCNV